MGSSNSYKKYSRKKESGSFARSGSIGRYYMHGSAARQLDEERDDVSLKYYGKMKTIEHKKTARMSFAKIACAMVVCLSAISMIFVKCVVYDYQLENDALQKELNLKKEQTASIIAQNTEKIDIAYVEEAAKMRLNMAKPQSYQIVYIEVPKTDYTIAHSADTVVEKEKQAFNSYRDVFTNIKNAGNIILASKAEKQ